MGSFRFSHEKRGGVQENQEKRGTLLGFPIQKARSIQKRKKNENPNQKNKKNKKNKKK